MIALLRDFIGQACAFVDANNVPILIPHPAGVDISLPVFPYPRLLERQCSTNEVYADNMDNEPLEPSLDFFFLGSPTRYHIRAVTSTLLI